MRRHLHIKSIYYTLLTAKFSEYSDLKNACSKNFSLTCHYGFSTDEARIVIQSKNILTLIMILIITIFKIYNDIWTGSLPIAFSCCPPALRRRVQLTACKVIQKIPNCQPIREIFLFIASHLFGKNILTYTYCI